MTSKTEYAFAFSSTTPWKDAFIACAATGQKVCAHLWETSLSHRIHEHKSRHCQSHIHWIENTYSQWRPLPLPQTDLCVSSVIGQPQMRRINSSANLSRCHRMLRIQNTKFEINKFFRCHNPHTNVMNDGHFVIRQNRTNLQHLFWIAESVGVAMAGETMPTTTHITGTWINENSYSIFWLM